MPQSDAMTAAVAITAGAQAKASHHKGMAVFVRAKGGLMYEASIGGQKYKFTSSEGNSRPWGDKPFLFLCCS